MGCLLPLERVACFWDFGDYYQVKDVEWRREMELAVERFGDVCDLVVFSGGNWDLWGVLMGVTGC